MKYRYIILTERVAKIKNKKKSGLRTVETKFRESNIACENFEKAYELADTFKVGGAKLIAIVQKEPLLNI